MTNYPPELAQDAVCRNHKGHTTGLWFLPARPLRLNTNEWMNCNEFISNHASRKIRWRTLWIAGWILCRCHHAKGLLILLANFVSYVTWLVSRLMQMTWLGVVCLVEKCLACKNIIWHMNISNILHNEYHLGTAVAQWLRCCAINRKVAGSIPADVIGIFHWHNSSDRTMALGSTQPLREMSKRNISWG